MKILFDTSILVPFFIEKLPAHQLVFTWVERVKNNDVDGVISAHTIAELYCNLTRFPQRPQIPPALARSLIERDIVPYFQLVALTETDYFTAMNHLVAEQISGAATYDALHVYAGIKAEVDHILTFNVRDFQRVYPAFAHKIIVP